MKKLRIAAKQAASELPKEIMIGSVIALMGLIPTAAQWLLVTLGLWNFDASLSGFNLRGWTNEVERPNQTIRADSVWSIPDKTVARVKDGGFITVNRNYSRYDFTYTAMNGSKTAWRAAPGSPYTISDSCNDFTFLPMSPPKDGANLLILFTVSPSPACTETT